MKNMQLKETKVQVQPTAGTKSRKPFISTTQISVLYKRGTIEKDRNLHGKLNQTAWQKKQKMNEKRKRKDLKRKRGRQQITGHFCRTSLICSELRPEAKPSPANPERHLLTGKRKADHGQTRVDVHGAAHRAGEEEERGSHARLLLQKAPEVSEGQRSSSWTSSHH